MAARVPVTFAPADTTVWAAVGSTVLSAARSAGVIIAAPCGGRGVCGSCGVIVVDGVLEPPDDIERSGLSSAPSNIRLACRARISSAVVLRPVVSQTYSASRSVHASGQALVAGVDLGTTTVSAVIVGRDSGMELGRGTVPNTQQGQGVDVLSRVSAAMSGAATELANDASSSVLAALKCACGDAGSCVDDIDRVVVAGNTAMHALLAGADLSTLAGAPFSLPQGLELPLSGPLSDALPGVEIRFVMPIASFVGGDTAAGLLSAGMIGAQSPEILVDIGTNAEIAAVTSLGVTVASAPAGPAFEGFGISSGGLWGEGAIEQVRARGDALNIVVAGGGEPRWLCGSGLISTIATLRRAGHISADGLMVSAGPWSDRFTYVGEILGFALSTDGDSTPFLLQTDVRAFQMAKAAVAAGIAAVFTHAGIKAKSVSRMVVSGGFGSTLDPVDLIELGVLPQELGDRIESAGNTSLLGAAMIAFDPDLLQDLERGLSGVRHLELARDPQFTDSYVAHTALEPFKLKGGIFGR